MLPLSPMLGATNVTAALTFVVLAGQACQSPAPTVPAHVEEGPAMRANEALEGGRYAEGYVLANDFDQAKSRVFEMCCRIVKAC